MKKIKSGFQQVGEFHNVFGHPVSDRPETVPAVVCKLRVNLIIEELAELVEAIGGRNITSPVLHSVAKSLRHQIKVVRTADHSEFKDQDLIEIADALTDINYVTYGGGHVWGLNLDDTMKEVHSSNMSKLGEDGLPIYKEDGKVAKGPNFVEPNIEAVIYAAALEASA